MKYSGWVWWHVLLKLGVALPILLWLSIRFGDYYAQFLLPLYRAVLAFALPDYSVLSLHITMSHGEALIAASVIAINSQVIGIRQVPAGFTVDASTLLAHALKHVLIVATAIVVWPNLNGYGRAVRALICAPLLLMIEALDIPLVLAGAVNDVVIANVAPNQTDHSWLVAWIHVMDGGARMALPLLSTFIAAAIHSALLNFWPPRNRARQHQSQPQ